MWGDIGFVHLGFDVRNMKALGETLAEAGFGFTCDTNEVLSMGESTKVHCTYVEDPDGTLIELIEGCDKRFETCRDRFANALNFRGEPHLPGIDLLTRYPGA